MAGALPDGIAVVALGGFGRRVLLPGSDVDLMVLHTEREAKEAAAVAERIFYPFWDAGIALGHAVRTVEACLEEARARVDVACSLLDARHLAGDGRLVQELDRELVQQLRGDDLVRRLRDDAAIRHGRYPAVSTVLEPDLKEGSGGLRDVTMVGWVRRVDPAVRLSDRDAAVLDAAEEFLIRVRSALHLEAGKRTDRLALEYQPSIAEAFGFEATVGLDAPDALMRALFGHGRDVEHVRDRVLHRTGSTADVARPASAEEALDMFARTGSTGEAVPADALEGAERVVEAAPAGPWTEGMRESFLRLLAGPHAGRALEAMDRIGALHRLLPEWEPVRCRPQRNPYHRYPVDMHLIRTLEGASRALRGDEEPEPMLILAAGAVEDHGALLLGALLHDIGKIGRPDHAGIGERVAAAAMERMGIGRPTRDDVLFLVRHHLLLSNTAVRRDLADENPILDVAGVVEDGRRLAMLYILTVADARATGPHAASPWRLALIREVVGKVQHVLDSGAGDTPPPTAIGERIEAIRGLLPAEAASAVDRFLNRLPRSYVLAVAPQVAAAHFRLLSTPVGRTEVRTLTGPGERPGTYDVAVVAADRPGLLARISGSLSLSALSILSAQAFTTEDGTAIDLFTVEPAFEGEVDEDRWRRFRTTLRRALEGRAWLEERVRERRAHERAPAAPAPTAVRVLDDASDFSTVVEVETTDRIGLLHDLARAFEDLGLDVHLAKVATYGPRVVDAFYVRDLEGRKLGETGRVEEVERALLERLEAG